MNEIEELPPHKRDALMSEIRAIVERSLTPLVQTFLIATRGTSSFKMQVGGKRRHLKHQAKIWGYSDLLRVVGAVWPESETDMNRMINLRDRGHHPEHDDGPIEDVDLIKFCKYNEQLLISAGALHDAKIVRDVLPAYLRATRDGFPNLSVRLPANFLFITESLAKEVLPATGFDKPLSAESTALESNKPRVSNNMKALTLKPRTETGVVRQTFSHGRTKQVVIEKVKKRTIRTE